MVSFTERGVKNYRTKTDWEKLLLKFDKNYEKYEKAGVINAASDASFRLRVSKLLNELGVNLEHHPAYFAYAQALYYAQFKYRYMVDRIREHKILRDKWERRGLDPNILDQLDKMLIFNYNIK
jgi:glutamine synthetase type III